MRIRGLLGGGLTDIHMGVILEALVCVSSQLGVAAGASGRAAADCLITDVLEKLR
jgi:hypothetical protein